MAEEREPDWVRNARRTVHRNALLADSGDGSERRGGAPGPEADVWYGPVGEYWSGPGAIWQGGVGGTSNSGVKVTAASSLQQSVVFGCVRVIAETLMTVPMELYRKAPGSKTREVVTSHPMLETLRQPNSHQLGAEFVETLTGHLVLRGTGFAKMIRGPRTGFADGLDPLLPHRLIVERLASGDLRYQYTELNGEISHLAESEVFRIPGFGGDGVIGYSVVTLAREAIGLALAEESFGARIFSQAALHAGILSHPGVLTPEAKKRLRSDWKKQYAGLANAHQPAVLEEGMKWQQVSMSSEDAQFLESRSFQAYEVARWFRVPPHLLGILDRSTNNNIEQQALEFVKFTMTPIAQRWAMAIKRELLEDPDLYVRFNFDDLSSGDLESWMKAHSLGVLNGIESPNEAREAKGMDPDPDGDGLRIPLNTGAAGGDPATTTGAPGAKPKPDPEDAAEPPEPAALLPVKSPQAHAFAQAAARRVVHREVTEIQRWAPRFAADPAGWKKWLDEFYAKHEDVVRVAMLIGDREAKAYCLTQRREAETLSKSDIAFWEVSRVAFLTALAEAEPCKPPPVAAPKRVTIERDAKGAVAAFLVTPESVSP